MMKLPDDVLYFVLEKIFKESHCDVFETVQNLIKASMINRKTHLMVMQRVLPQYSRMFPPICSYKDDATLLQNPQLLLKTRLQEYATAMFTRKSGKKQDIIARIYSKLPQTPSRIKNIPLNLLLQMKSPLNITSQRQHCDCGNGMEISHECVNVCCSKCCSVSLSFCVFHHL
jgi:hypothetical protein